MSDKRINPYDVPLHEYVHRLEAENERLLAALSVAEANLNIAKANLHSERIINERLKAERIRGLSRLAALDTDNARLQAALAEETECARQNDHLLAKAEADNERLTAERNEGARWRRQGEAELRAEVERLRAVISDAPILSKYHGHHGFEAERFIADYEAWKRRALENKP